MENSDRTANDRKRQIFAIRLSLAFGVIMLAMKWYAYGITNSAAILSDAAESVVHIVAVAFAAFSMWLSHQPEDQSHPYGHDKISFFSAGIEGILIILAAGFIIYESTSKFIFGIEITNLGTGTWFTFAASMVNLVLGVYLVWEGKRTHSLILTANGKHVLTDSWTSFGVVGGLVLVLWTGWLPFDPLFAMAVALNILWSGGKLVRQAVGGLMDESDPETESTLRQVLDEETVKHGLEYHELRYRTSGHFLWIEYHLLFPERASLSEAHRMATEIEDAVNRAVNRPARITSHLEPSNDHDDIHTDDLHHTPIGRTS